MGRRGFTLLEIMVVVAIISILASIGLVGVSRHTDKTRVQKAARDLAQRIAQARSIAEQTGPRIGTPQLVAAIGCPAVPNAVAIFIDPASGSYVVPTDLSYDSTTDTMTISCTTYDVGSTMFTSETHGLGTLITPGGPITISFSATGRVLRGGTTPATDNDWYFAIMRNGNPVESFGYRILPSGIVCRSTYSGAVRCNEDP